MAGALDGICVLDLAGMPGQYCTRLLADVGADVIKIESPSGDPARRLSPFASGVRDLERSLVFLNYNTNKRSVVLDIETADGQETLRRLVRTADVLVESYQPGYLRSLGLGQEELRSENPSLIIVSITPFGQTGPHSAHKGLDLHAQAMGGLLTIQGDDTKAPVMAPAEQGYQMTSLHAALGVMYALLARQKTGRGQHVDVSMQEVIANTFFQIVRYSALGEIERRPGVGTNLPLIGLYRCKDGGWVNMTPLYPNQVDTMLQWLGDPRFQDAAWRDREFQQQNAEVIVEAMNRFAERFDAADLVDQAQERRIPCELVALPMDFAKNPQLADRGYFTKSTHPVIGDHFMPGPPFRLSETPLRLSRSAPLLGEHTSEVLADLATAEARNLSGSADRTGASEGSDALPLDGVRVIDFTRVWVGPYATRLLADYGAEVIKIESGLFDLTTRAGPVPMAADLNRNKMSITLDLHHPEAQQIIKRLVAQSDVVMDNYAVGVMDRFGFSYEELRRSKEEIIQVSMPGWGNTGPWREHVSFGGQLLSASGLGYLWGHPDSPPNARAKFPYVDFLVAVHATLAVLIGVYHQRRTGQGQSIEVSQAEAMGHTMGVPLADYFINGNPGEPRGNVHLDFAPHGVYPCRGDDAWAAVACTSDEEWRALREVLGSPEWAAESRFETMAGRLECRDEIDAYLTTWTVELTPKQVMYKLQRAGVPAAAVQNTEDVFYDSHLRARGYVVELDHPDWGRLHHAGLTVRLSETPGAIRTPSPALGQHNDYVLKDLLGLSNAEVRKLRDAKALA